MFFDNIYGFIVCNGGLVEVMVGSDQIVAVDMDFYFITALAGWHFLLCDTIIGIDADDIGIPEIGRVVIGKIIVPVFNCIIADAIAVQDIYLHAVVCHKQVASAFHDLVIGIIKQIIDIKGKDGLAVVVIQEKMRHDINRCFDIDAVVPEIDQCNELVKAKIFRHIARVCTGRIREDHPGLAIGTGCPVFFCKAAKADVLIAVCKADPVIG